MSKMFARKISIIPFIVFFVSLSVLFILVFSFFKIRPIVIKVAKSNLDYIGNKVVNASIEKHFKDVKYEDIVTLIMNENRISAISVDFAKLNVIKSKITLEITEDIQSISNVDISIPMGNFFNNEFLMGIGPDIPFKVVPYGTVYVNFRDEFAGLGINQTVHEIYLDVKTDIGAIIPGFKTNSEIVTSMMVAHTVIVGDVPENYTGVNEIAGKVEDYILDIVP